jgi:hypothetical protein
MLDFAGFYGHLSMATIFLYGTISVAAIAVAQLLYRVRLARA